MSRKRLNPAPIVCAAVITALLCGCSIKKMAVRSVANVLSSEGGTVFTGDNDPQLVGDAIPFALKMHESLLAADSCNPRLLLATGRLCCMYAYAYIQAPAEQMADAQNEEQRRQLKRAKNLFIRGRDYVLRGMEINHRGFRDLLNRNKSDSAMALMSAKDTSYLYWAAASWMGAVSADKFNLGLIMTISRSVAMMKRVIELCDGYGDGAAHEFFISYYGSMPPSMGGSEQKAREHFAKAIELSHNVKCGPYVSLATAVCIKKQDRAEFTDLLNKALAVDVNASLPNRLVNIIGQQKARWYLEHADDFFLESGEEKP